MVSFPVLPDPSPTTASYFFWVFEELFSVPMTLEAPPRAMMSVPSSEAVYAHTCFTGFLVSSLWVYLKSLGKSLVVVTSTGESSTLNHADSV